MSPQIELFRDYQLLKTPRVTLLGDNRLHSVLGYGAILLEVPTRQSLSILDVLYVHGLAKNLLSVSQITTIGNTIITFTESQCLMKTKSSESSKQMISNPKRRKFILI